MNEKTVRIPCYKCGSKKVNYRDCGYTTFNPGEISCIKCDNTIKVMDCDYFNPWPQLRKRWNYINNKKRKEKEISNKKSEICKLLNLKSLEDIESLNKLINIFKTIEKCHKK